MSESLINYKSLRLDLIVTLLLCIIFFVGGFFIGQLAMPVAEFNLLVVILVYACLPIVGMFLGFYVGLRAKRESVQYQRPNWNYKPLGLTLEECRNMIKHHNKQFFRVIAYSNYWFFFLPPVFAIVSVGLPFYSFYEDSSIQGFVPITFAFILLSTFIISEYGSFRASYNEASKDFTLLLIREAIALARTQSNVLGVSKIHVVLDHASVGDYHVYRNPRVVARISGTEESAYIESLSEDIGAIDRLLIRLNLASDIDKIIWWWQSRDRIFRKYVGDDEDGYYVQSPVQSLTKELGVKDVRLVTENAVALLLLEWMRIHGEDSDLKETLTKLHVNL